MKPSTESLTLRIDRLRAELDEWIDDRARAEVANNPGVPVEAIRNMLTYHSSCQCACVKHMLNKEREPA